MGGGRAILLLMLVLAARPAIGAGADELLRDATRRIDQFVDRFRRTGDRSDLDSLVAADRSLRAAVRGFEDSGDQAGAALATIKLGQIARMQGVWAAAIAHYQRAEELATIAHHAGHRARALTDRALAEVSASDVGAALAHAQVAVALTGALGDPKLSFDALDVLATAQLKQGNTNAAAESLNRALAVPGLKDEVTFYGYLDRADLYRGIAQRCDQEPVFSVCLDGATRAQADYREAAAIAERLKWGGLARQAEEFRREVDLLKQMIASRQRSQDVLAKTAIFHPRSPSNVLVTEHFAPGEVSLPPPLLKLFEESKRRHEQAGGFGQSVQAARLFVEGMMRQAQGDHAAALPYFRQAVEVIERDRRAVGDESARGAFLADKTQIYVAAILELLDAHEYAEAFELMERSRARAISEMILGRKPELSGAGEQQLYADLTQVRAEMARRQAELFKLINRKADPARIADADRVVSKLEEDEKKLRARMQATSPRLRQLTAPDTLPLGAFQQLLKEARADALEYLVTDTALVLWHIGPDAVHVRNVFVPRSELTASIKALRASIGEGHTPFDVQRARELYLQLVEPARAFLTSERLVIVPHDALNDLPFAVLENPKDGRAVGESWALAQAPSATLYAALRPWSQKEARRAVAAADPGLGDAVHEMTTLEEIYRPGFRRLGGAGLATETEIKAAVADSEVVHLAVHGQFDPGQPLLSHLTLAPSARDDGQLTAAEMFGLSLGRARLVVLSACESGRVETGRANEAAGMLQGLLYAGAGAMVLSSWKVDSASTTLWMQTFHRAARTTTLPEAARRALLAVKNTPAYGHPFFWGPFSAVARQ